MARRNQDETNMTSPPPAEMPFALPLRKQWIGHETYRIEDAHGRHIGLAYIPTDADAIVAAVNEAQALREVVNICAARLGCVHSAESVIAAVGHVADECERLTDEHDELRTQLPEQMPSCTIKFLECEQGHGRLWATNWIDHGCPTCERDSLRDSLQASQVAEQMARDDVRELKRENERLREALYEVEDYLEDRADVVDGPYGEPAPNKEMSLLQEVRAALHPQASERGA